MLFSNTRFLGLSTQFRIFHAAITRTTTPTTSQCIRCLHSGNKKKNLTVPSPTPFVPDVKTFLTLIGREQVKFADKFSSWEQLFTLSSPELRDLGIEPPRQRRYLLRHREKFRRGIYGPGGDLDVVVDGVAQLRVVEIPDNSSSTSSSSSQLASTSSDTNPNALATATSSPGTRKVIVNLPPDATEYKHDPNTPIKRYAGMRIHRGNQIKGPYLQPLKGTNGTAALIRVVEGMWEDKRGHKVDGGERRRAEVRAKRRAAERRAAAEEAQSKTQR
ncbi:hypothetical protein VTN49DRAFT_2117 [Thermomyces lanuginosus]|uniref:mitochondrial 37S ribosomal protein mS41 n=1 Tax=Thermomyces lanuginosus TaxID=5541 RepID=UPI003743C085